MRISHLRPHFPYRVCGFFQELASRIGNKTYLSHLDKLNYGNKKTGKNVKTFWLEGDLKISAKEQIEFLKKLYRNELPYKKIHINLLKRLMIVDQTHQYIIRAKTGWTMRISPQHGWYVGYVVTHDENENAWFFATNFEIKDKGDARFRDEITIEALRMKGIIPE